MILNVLGTALVRTSGDILCWPAQTIIRLTRLHIVPLSCGCFEGPFMSSFGNME